VRILLFIVSEDEDEDEDEGRVWMEGGDIYVWVFWIWDLCGRSLFYVWVYFILYCIYFLYIIW
jgi:hypothetical protein